MWLISLFPISPFFLKQKELQLFVNEMSLLSLSSEFSRMIAMDLEFPDLAHFQEPSEVFLTAASDVSCYCSHFTIIMKWMR
jgi:hypothetical protein